MYLMQQSISVNLSIPLYHGGPGMSKLHLLEDDEHDNYKLNTNLKQFMQLHRTSLSDSTCHSVDDKLYGRAEEGSVCQIGHILLL